MVGVDPVESVLAVGGSAQMKAVVGGQSGVEKLSYQWYLQAGAQAPRALVDTGTWKGTQSGTLQLMGAGSLDSGLVWVVVEGTSSGAVQSVPALVWVNARNPIRMQPQPVLQVEGGTAYFRVEAVGEGLTYEWKVNGQALEEQPSRVMGVKSPLLEVRNVGMLDAGSYTVLVTVPGTDVVAQSEAAVLVVRRPPQIVEQPQRQLLNAGSLAVLSVGVETSRELLAGEPDAVFQWWYKAKEDAHEVLPVPGGGQQTVRINPVEEADDGFYAVAVSNAAGTTWSEWVRVQVKDPAVITRVSGSPVQGNPGSTVRLEVEATGDGVVYQWYRMRGSVEQALVGRTGPALELVNVSEDDEGDYRVKVTSDAMVRGANGMERSSAKSGLVRVEVNNPVAFSGMGARRELVVRAGDATVLVANATGYAPRFQWYRNGEVIRGGEDGVLTLTNIGAQAEGVYSVGVYNGFSSAGPREVARVQVLLPPELSVEGLAGVYGVGSVQAGVVHRGVYLVDEGERAFALQGVVRAGVDGKLSEAVSYQWIKDGQRLGGVGVLTAGLESSQALVTLPLPRAGVFGVSREDGGRYELELSNSNGKTVSGAVVVAVQRKPEVTLQPESKEAAEGGVATFRVEATGVEPMQYQWLVDGREVAGATLAALSLSEVKAEQSGAEVSVRVSNRLGTVMSAVAKLTVVSGAIRITEQPVFAARAGVYGARPQLRVRASGAQLSYEWRKDGKSLQQGGSDTIVLGTLTAESAGVYDVVVSNPGGIATSAAAVLVMDPTIESVVVQGRVNPAEGEVVWVVPGAGVRMQVNAVSASTAAQDLKVQWEKRENGGVFEPVTGTGVSGGTMDTLWIASARAADAGEYRVRVSSEVSTGTSAVVALRVAEPPVVKGVSVWSNAREVSGALKAGEPVELRVAVEGAGELTYAWYRDGQLLESGEGGGGVLRIAAVQSGDAGQYQVEVTNLAGTVRSVPVGVEVVSKPVIVLPAGVSVKEGETVSVLAEVTGVEVQYQWQREQGGRFTLLAQETEESLVIPFATLDQAGWYKLVASNAAGVSEAVVRLEVSQDGGSGGGSGGGSSGGNAGGNGGGLALSRWWVFEESVWDGAAWVGAPGMVVWVYDRVQQRSAWLWREGGEAGEWKMSVWAVEDQQVAQLQKGGKGAKAGVLTFEVEAERPGMRDATVWDGFALSGDTGAEGVPEVLSGEYGEGGEGTRRAITLRSSAERIGAMNGFGELREVFEWISGAASGD